MVVAPAGRAVRLAELLAVLSLGTDLGMNQPMEHVMRQSLIALRLAERLGLGEDDRRVVSYTGLIAWVGCHVDAYEQAKWFGDDLALKGDARLFDLGRALPALGYMARHVSAGKPPLQRARTAAAFLAGGRQAAEDMLENHWLASNELASRLGLGQDVLDSVYQTFERWDGRGVPAEAVARRSCSPLAWSTSPTLSRCFTAAAGSTPRSRSRASAACLRRLCPPAASGARGDAREPRGVDAIVFTGGIGEAAPAVRAAALEPFGFLGLGLDPDHNAASPDDADIARDRSRVSVLVIEAREDWAIARSAANVAARAPVA